MRPHLGRVVRVWDGNEFYLLLWAYAVLACGFAYGGIRLLRR